MAKYSKFQKLTPAPNPYTGVIQPTVDNPEAIIGPRPVESDYFDPGSPYGGGVMMPGGMIPGGGNLGGYHPGRNDFNRDLREWEEKKRQLEQGLNPDGSPMAPEFRNLIDPETGRLKGGLQMSLEGVPGFQQYQDFATGEGPSRFAQAATNELGLKAAFERDRAVKEAQQAYGVARGTMAMRGGITSGASERLAGNAMDDMMDAKQRVRGGEMSGLASILTQDAGARQDALGRLVGLGAETERFNLGAALDEINAERSAAWKTYEEKGGQWAARKKAEEMAANSGGGGGGGCCFILLEARYGNGTMDEVVRRYRDENMNEKNRRGYYKMAEVVVPMMRKSKVFKWLVKKTMADPLVAYGKYYYGKNKWGWMMKPVADFWLKTFEYLGGEHEFIRENGEVV